MTYYYLDKGTLFKKVGGDPPAAEYVAIDPLGTVRHIKNGAIDRAQKLKPGDNEDIIAQSMLKYRKRKTTKPKTKRCKCK
jgi:hypothetical protein